MQTVLQNEVNILKQMVVNLPNDGRRFLLLVDRLRHFAPNAVREIILPEKRQYVINLAKQNDFVDLFKEIDTWK